MKPIAFALAAALTTLPLAGSAQKHSDASTGGDESFSLQLKEVTVKPKKEKYSKRDNPAVDLMRRIKQGGEDTDPRRHDNYNYHKYERITLAINDFKADSTSAMQRSFPELVNYIDTSTITGKPILNVALREKASTVHFRRQPSRGEKEVIHGLRREGFDQILDPDATQTLYEDVMREVDIYGNDITLLQNKFVSPLSRIAPDFYKYYLNDTINVGVDTLIVLSFVPHNPRSFGFTGKLYVEKGDTSAFVRRIEMNVPVDINLNYINHLRITQEYGRAADGTRLKMLDDMVIEAGFIGKKSNMYARRVTAYGNHSFDPAPDPTVFKHLGNTLTVAGATERDAAFWQQNRLVAIGHGEGSIDELLYGLRRNKLFYWSEKVVKLMATGYVTTGNPSKWDFGPLNTFISGNTLEGMRLRMGGMTTANLSKHFFTKGYVAYGTSDHKWKYLAEAEWSFREKNYHSREFPVHSLRLTHHYDVDMLGQHYLFTNPDNVFLSLKRADDDLMTYHRITKLDYELELENNFSVKAQLKHERMEQSPFVAFTDGYGHTHSHFNTTSATLTLRYAPGEKFYQTKTTRLPVNLDAPIFQISHTFAPKGSFGNMFALNVTEAYFQKRWWFSAFGFTDVILKGGHVWSQSPFTQLNLPNANLSYTIQPESFALMNPLEFISDTYCMWDVTYWLNGALLNCIPLLRKLRLREAVEWRGWWGSLSSRNDPQLHPELFRFLPTANTVTDMGDTPYMEIAAGLDNIFRILRVDYTWRLTYRNSPGAPNSGLRIALHFTF